MPLPKWFAHANVNTADLDRAEAFYGQCLQLAAQWRTAPSRPQEGTGFGMPGVDVQWRGALLTDHRGLGAPIVDLLEWVLPATEGRPYDERNHVGLAALLFSVPDLDATASVLLDAGAPVSRQRYDDAVAGPLDVLVTRDPDGTWLEIGTGADAPTYRGVRVNCTDLDRSSAFYRTALQVIGDPPRSVVIAGAEGQASGRFVAQRLVLPHRPDGFFVELTQWDDPAPVGQPYATGNHAGIYRLALSVDDMDASWRELAGAVPGVPEPVTVDLGDNLGSIGALFFPDPDGTILEFLERGLR